MGEVGLQILPSDKISGGDRWLAKLNASHYIDQTKSIGVTFLRVSDDNYFADFGPLDSFFRTFSEKKLQHNFPKMRGRVKGRLEFFRNFIRYGSLTRP